MFPEHSARDGRGGNGSGEEERNKGADTVKRARGAIEKARGMVVIFKLFQHFLQLIKLILLSFFLSPLLDMLCPSSSISLT